MRKRIIGIGLALLMCVGLFGIAGCGAALPYNAVMYGNVYEVRAWLDDDFYEENLTLNSYSQDLGDYIKDEAYPRYITKIIVDKSKFDETFKAFPVEVDFEKDMVLLHCFTTASSGEYEIKSISIDAQVLSISYKNPVSKDPGPHPPDASMPMTKWVVVKMDKLDIISAEFIFGN